ncbi:post-GPI attachment to proteins factor 2 [Aplysia californica]|uniref:Post-GPI attachment to proteins factor 2 n=1 Tax=Aplysia californica TaxID=6500 RepID=A0ABM0JK76_APLCA|nr:post-GPI attachment to proteins factor 2 [Aplysia californica]
MQVHRNYPHFYVFFPHVIGISCILPLGALLFCELWSVLADFKASTATTCDRKIRETAVWNFLPSISEATGRLTPQRYVWQICIALHCTPRFLIALGYRSVHRGLFPRSGALARFAHLSRASYLLHMTEICALIGLSIISSSENYEIHKFCFITFMLCATLHMLSMCVLYGPGLRAVQFGVDETEERSLRLKQILTFVNITTFVVAMYFFYRHNTYCEDGVYSLFALCEIVVVVTNIAFHSTAMLDFNKSHVVLQDGIGR